MSDESGVSSRFFTLKKDSERRHTLATVMVDYQDDVSFILKILMLIIGYPGGSRHSCLFDEKERKKERTFCG